MNPVPSTPPPPLVGRLAPSPTGALHLGNARSFLLAWLSIRLRGGNIILRMEDLDHPKVKQNAAADAIHDLRWLGLDWDTEHTQSERREIYRDTLAALRAKKLVYPCVCSRSQLEDAQSAPHISSRDHILRYAGTCRDKFQDWKAAQNFIRTTAAADGSTRLPVWRFNTAGITQSKFEDGFCGWQSLDTATIFGDFALARDADGAGYTLAVVADDAAMGVTEVLRGNDLLDATHCQLALYNALGFAPPRFIHVPLVVAEDGRRLAKRHGDTRISALRAAGNSPQKILGLLAWWCGWAEFGEELTLDEILRRFNLQTLNKEPAILTPAVLQMLQIAE